MAGEIQRILRSGRGSPRNRLLACLIHVLLWPLLLVPRLFWPRRDRCPGALGPDARILLIRVDGIGDLTMSAAIFPALRKKFPRARIDLLTSDAAQSIGQLLVAAGWIDNLWVLPLLGRSFNLHRQLARRLRTVRYDVGIDLRGDLRNVLLMWMAGARARLGMPGGGLTYLLTDCVQVPLPHHQSEQPMALVKRLGVNEVDPYPRLPLRPEDRAAAEQWLAASGLRTDRPLCAFHLGAFQPSKVWPLDRFACVARRLRQEHEAQLLVVGGKDDADLALRFREQVGGTVAIAAGAVSLAVAAALLARCTILIGNDSGPAHVAAAVGCGVVMLFGNGTPQAYGALSPHAVWLRSSRPCDSRCDKLCAQPERFCMLDLTADMVFAAASNLLGQCWTTAASAPTSGGD